MQRWGREVGVNPLLLDTQGLSIECNGGDRSFLVGLVSVLAVWCQTFTQDLIDSNFTNSCPRDIKLNQSEEDMPLHLLMWF